MNQILAPTITTLPADVAGRVIVTGSHGGLYAGHLVLEAKARAAIFNDAGMGRDNAGVGALGLLQQHGRAAAAVAHSSARIGDTDDMMSGGIISTVNALAKACGIVPGTTCRDAASMLESAPLGYSAVVAAHCEARSVWTSKSQTRPLILVDSASLVSEEDIGAIIVTGSHGGLIGGDPAKALRAAGFAAVFNDAGIGKDEAGTTRLPALDNRRIAAFTVAAASARIGDARSTFEDGIVSRVNKTAQALGARVGLRAKELCERWARKPRP